LAAWENAVPPPLAAPPLTSGRRVPYGRRPQALDLADNNIEALPVEIGNLTNLEYLSLDGARASAPRRLRPACENAHPP